MSAVYGTRPATSLTVDVVGLPAPQGSKRHVGGGRLIESSKKVGPWRQDVAAAVVAAMRAEPGCWPLSGPLHVSIVFRLHRPASAPKSRHAPFQRPDLDKLVRSTFDAISTAGAWADDAQVVSLGAEKRFAAPGEPLGAHITVIESDDMDDHSTSGGQQ